MGVGRRRERMDEAGGFGGIWDYAASADGADRRGEPVGRRQRGGDRQRVLSGLRECGARARGIASNLRDRQRGNRGGVLPGGPENKEWRSARRGTSRATSRMAVAG